MIFHVEEGVFADESLRRPLRRLFDAVADAPLPELHAVLVAEESPAVKDWLRRQGDDRARYEEVLEASELVATLQGAPASYLAGTYRVAGPLSVNVVAGLAGDWRGLRLGPVDAVELLQEPVHIWLENGRHDLAFLRWLAPPSTRADLVRLEQSPSGMCSYGGGSGEIKAHLKSLVEAKELRPDQLRRLWRTVVVFDRDAAAHDAREPSAGSDELATLCEQVVQRHGVPLTWVRLQRREIESYLPDDALWAAKKRGLAEHLTKWRGWPDRRPMAWAFDMKLGLRGDLNDSVSAARRHSLNKDVHQVPQPHELRAPFDQLNPTERAALARGYGARVLNEALQSASPPPWLTGLAAEYDRGPDHQLERGLLVQSLLDRA
jgi:hypothetical protein